MERCLREQDRIGLGSVYYAYGVLELGTLTFGYVMSWWIYFHGRFCLLCLPFCFLHVVFLFLFFASETI